MKEQYSVGEFGEVFRLNVQTLRYYDSIGLFSPAQRDARTGRRRYAFEQVYGMASIRFMRRLGYSLEDVQDYLNRRQGGDALDVLKKRSDELRRQLMELQALDGAIRRKIRYTEAALADVQAWGGEDSVTVQTMGERRYIPIGEEELLYYDDSFYLYPTIVFYKNGQKLFGAYLYEEKGIPQDSPAGAAVIPPGRYLCGYHRGPYEQIRKSSAHMRAAFPHLVLSPVTIDFNIVDQFVERDSQNYLTAIQIQVME